MVNVNGLQAVEIKLLASAAVCGELLVSNLEETRAALNLSKWGLIARNENAIGFQAWKITEHGRQVAGNVKAGAIAPEV